MVAELQEMMHAQFQSDAVDASRFEARIVEGCHSLCSHVHQLAGGQHDIYNGLRCLISTVKEIASTVNTDH
jgi:hypothetical protein